MYGEKKSSSTTYFTRTRRWHNCPVTTAVAPPFTIALELPSIF
ncbi:hypothetical protein A2U01_0062360, partial [Trifolium medium]|nr:hypothetical protein [Trifolium medium]